MPYGSHLGQMEASTIPRAQTERVRIFEQTLGPFSNQFNAYWSIRLGRKVTLAEGRGLDVKMRAGTLAPPAHWAARRVAPILVAAPTTTPAYPVAPIVTPAYPTVPPAIPIPGAPPVATVIQRAGIFGGDGLFGGDGIGGMMPWIIGGGIALLAFALPRGKKKRR